MTRVFNALLRLKEHFMVFPLCFDQIIKNDGFWAEESQSDRKVENRKTDKD